MHIPYAFADYVSVCCPLMSTANADNISAMIKPEQCRMARAALQWSLKNLAERSRVNHVTINRFEMGQSASNPSTLAAIRIALEAAGVEFIPENGGGAGVRLRRPDHGRNQ
jgi:hypothetical protein